MVGFDHRKEELTPWEYSFAGALSGAVTRFVGQPFDVLKTRFQLQVEPVSHKSKQSKYNSMTQATLKIISEEGISGLWKGHFSGQLLSIIYGIVQFQAFERTTKTVQLYANTDTKSTGVHAICGTIAGSIATVVSFPFDVIRTRFIAQGNEQLYKSLHHGFQYMIRHEGPSSLFKGLSAALLLSGPQAGAIFAFHNVFSAVYKELVPKTKKDLDVIGNLLVGSLAGVCGKTVVYPLDLSRKRLQLQGFQGRKGFGENFTCRGLMNCVYLTASKEGVHGLFKGVVPSILKAAVTTALHFTAYEETCKILAKRRHRS